MLTVSPRWAPAHRASHRPISRVEVWRTSSRLIADLKVESAAISKDATSTIRASASVTVADLTPATAQLLTPFGNRLRFYAGIKYPDNTTEMILVADLDIVASTLTLPDATLHLDCVDPAGIIGQDETSGPITPPAADSQGVIQWILGGAMYYGGKALPAALPVTNPPIPADWNMSGDRWDAVEQLADAMGCECFFDVNRNPILRDVPPIKPTPDATLYALDGGTVTRIVSGLSRSPNVVTVLGAPDATGKQSRGLARDDNPSSPTYRRGAYGRVTLHETRDTVLSQAGADSAAAALLRRVQGKTRTVELSAVTDPAIEPGDTVMVRYTSGSLERHLVQSVSFPLGAEEMTVGTRTLDYKTFGWP